MATLKSARTEKSIPRANRSAWTASASTMWRSSWGCWNRRDARTRRETSVQHSAPPRLGGAAPTAAHRRNAQARATAHCFALDNHGQSDRPFHRAGLSEVRALLRAAGSEKFQLQLAAGLVPALPRFRRIVLPARDVDRGARADAIEESWYGWQEGEREVCPECQGARLNPVARAVRLDVGQASRLSRFSTKRIEDRLEPAPTIDDFSAPVRRPLHSSCSARSSSRAAQRRSRATFCRRFASG